MPDTEIEMAKNGEFLREYGKQYFIVALEALNIGRVKWSMVPIGKKGQDDVSFYMTVEDFRWLCRELLRGVAQKKIADDKDSPYPTAYKYVTGNNGCKVLNIGGAKLAGMCRINMQDKSKTPAKNYIMAVSIKSLEYMAQRFTMDTAEYERQVVAAFEDGRKERAKYKHTLSADDDVVNTPADDTTPAAPVNAAPASTSAPKPTAAPKPESPKAETKPVVNDEYVLTVKGPKKETKDKAGNAYWSFTAMKGNDKLTLLFPQDKAKELNWFSDFEKAAQRPNGHELTINATRNGDFLIYKD